MWLKVPTKFYDADQETMELILKGVLDESSIGVEDGYEWINTEFIERFNENEEGVTVQFVSGVAKVYYVSLNQWLKMIQSV